MDPLGFNPWLLRVALALALIDAGLLVSPPRTSEAPSAMVRCPATPAAFGSPESRARVGLEPGRDPGPSPDPLADLALRD